MTTVNEDIQNKIKIISEKVIDIKNSNDQISKKCDDVNSRVTVFPTKINDIESQTKQILDKILFVFDLSSAKIGSSYGIIRNLTDKCGGNVHDKGIVNVTSSSYCDYRYHPKNAVDFNDNDKYFASDYKEKGWIKYDFKNKKVNPVGYSIKFNYEIKPSNWVIEGSNTDFANDWDILDIKYDFKFCKDNCTFLIQKSCNFYRYLRIRQIGEHPNNSYTFYMEELDYYGIIK